MRKWDEEIVKRPVMLHDGADGYASRPRLVIPCEVAPQQSLPPFHRAILL